jgi:GST-like protein
MSKAKKGGSAPIALYSWATPNGQKVHIALEELELPYEVHAIDIGAGDQFRPEFLSISPNNKIPAILDPSGPEGKPYPVFESGAILLYLAGKTGKLLGKNDTARYNTLQWLMFQMGGVGPMLGQAHHFRIYAPEKIQYGIDRYTNEARRLYGVIDKQLGKSEYLAGKKYTIADIATWPWLRSHERQGIDLADFPNIQRWFAAIDARPAVQRGLLVLKDVHKPAEKDPKALETMFGATQYQKR